MRAGQYYLSSDMPITVHQRTQQMIDELQDEIGLLKAQKKVLKAQNKKLQDEKKVLQAEKMELKKANEQLKEEVGSFGIEASHAWEDRMRLGERLNDAETQLATTPEELALSKQRERELKEELVLYRA
jgi:hypothetical protein